MPAVRRSKRSPVPTGRLPLVVVLVVVMQLALPTIGLVARWTGVAEASRFAWQMYSTNP